MSASKVSKPSPDSQQAPLAFCSSISSQGLETHKIQTEDGYILSIFRLVEKPEGIPEKTGESPRIPVLLIPGLCNDGTEWLLLDEERSLRKDLKNTWKNLFCAIVTNFLKMCP